MLGIDDGRVNIGKDFKLIGNTDILTVGRHTIGNNAVANLVVGVRLDHFMLFCHLSDPVVGLQSHNSSYSFNQNFLDYRS